MVFKLIFKETFGKMTLSNYLWRFIGEDNIVVDTGEIIFANLNLQDNDFQ